jgi:organic hydroperoxide reductase OsmC/OhrA
VSDRHLYRCRLAWSGSTGEGYGAYLRLSSDPAFGGDPRLLDPEQLLLVAASSCQLLSFLAIAARARIDVVAYEDEAEAEMPEDEKPMRITRIVLRPRITARGDADEERLRRYVKLAHEHCFIANSLNSELVIEPAIEIVE